MDITQTKAYKAGWQDFMTGQQLSRKGTSSSTLQFANRYMWAANAHDFNNCSRKATNSL
jgi:hypothetical protein